MLVFTLENLGLLALVGALVLGWKLGAHLDDDAPDCGCDCCGNISCSECR